MEQQLHDHEERRYTMLELAAYVASLCTGENPQAPERDPPNVVQDAVAALGGTAIQLLLPLEWGGPTPRVKRLVERPALQAIRRTFTDVVEIVDGRRSAFTLYGRLSEEAYTSLTEHDPQRKLPPFAARLRSVHAQQPVPNVIEACAVIDRGPHVQALAARFERRRRRWIGTALEWH